MRAVIQRVSKAEVTTGEELLGRIGHGMVVLLGIEEADTLEDVDWLCRKIVQLRIFADTAGVMNHSVTETAGGILVVSQFTLHASTKKGNRPSYIRAARPGTAIPLYEATVRQLSELTGTPAATGKFGAMMQVSLVNDGPVTILIDTKNRE